VLSVGVRRVCHPCAVLLHELIFAIYEDVDGKPDLFSLPSQDQFKPGYVTYGTYANNTSTIQNDGHTLTVGP